MMQSPDRPLDGIHPEEGLSGSISDIEQICHLRRARKMVPEPSVGSDPGHHADGGQEAEIARPAPHQHTLQSYPIFDRDGKAARMIGVDAVPSQEPMAFCGMVGISKQMSSLFQLIRLVASSKTTVLIYGESGTGKELVARAIHQCSVRRHRPFIPIDCGALSEPLLESELFGHVKGAFTGAIQHKKGLFEEAQGGTLFLDEIGDTSPAFQSKLLRALQEGEIRSVGGARHIRINVRVVAATNKRLKEAVANKTFRDDLYYRLAVMPIMIPPLRERTDDILPLARHFIRTYAEQNGKAAMRLSHDAAHLLPQLPWRGNVRELENVIERAVLLCSGGLISAESLLIDDESRQPEDGAPAPFSRQAPASLSAEIEEICAQAECEKIAAAIRRHRGNKVLAARSLGIARSSLYNKLKRYKLEHKSFDLGV